MHLKSVKSVAVAIIVLASTAAQAKDYLLAGEELRNGAYINSPNGRYSLIMQTDGSLVMYRNDGTIRYSMEKRGTYAIMQPDGNFVQYANTTALWHTGTYGCCDGAEVFLLITDDGNLAVIKRVESSGYGYAVNVWEIGRDPVPLPPPQYPMTKLTPPGPPPTYSPGLPSFMRTEQAYYYGTTSRY